MKVLIACEFSGTVRDAFTREGHDATSCDLLPSETPGKHYVGDVRDILDQHWDMLIAHPPCTYLTNSGVCWLHKDKKRWANLKDGAEFFRTLLNANIPMIAVENPIPHKYALKIIGKKYSQIVQPWMFGHKESKATCLWLKGLPDLKATRNVREQMLKLPKNQAQRLHYLPPSPDRWKERSKTFKGLANAMAKQWGRARKSQNK